MHALRLGVAAALLAAPAPLAAQTLYPTRTITLVSPQSPGTAMDVLARIYADKADTLREYAIARHKRQQIPRKVFRRQW